MNAFVVEQSLDVVLLPNLLCVFCRKATRPIIAEGGKVPDVLELGE
jgi:hypothetical protein